jgi:hypothetical protein
MLFEELLGSNSFWKEKSSLVTTQHQTLFIHYVRFSFLKAKQATKMNQHSFEMLMPGHYCSIYTGYL